jgi:phenylalanine-4-hydroxylase
MDGLTTTKAPLIENAHNNGELFIRQPYELYSRDNQKAWTDLFLRMEPLWEKYGNSKFLDGLKKISISHHQIPNLEEVNTYLKPLTGFQAKAVSGFVPTYLFFDSLSKREFPTTITIRDSQSLDYLPEPDIFHDIGGHVPMHADPVFANVLVKFGQLAARSAEKHANIKNPHEKILKVRNNIQALARFFWFTIEFGLIKEKDGLKAYGSGLMSSAGEIVHAVESPDVQRFPLQLEWVINQSYEINHYQPLLFVIDSFDSLYKELGRLEEWLLAGRLDNAAPGEPHYSEDELETFLQ